MNTYYCILEFESEVSLFLGKLPLVDTEDGVALDKYDGAEPIATDGTVPRPWGPDDESSVPLPDTVDSTDPFQVAPTASFYQRPYGALSDVLDDQPEAVHVFTTDTDDETALSDVNGVEYYENVTGERAGGDIQTIERGYEWDETAVNTGATPTDVKFSTATHLVGFVDGQDMHDPYTHLGVAKTDSAIQAFYDVLTALDGTPLWTPEAYTVDEHQTFEASAVLNPDYKYPSEA
jgi:hypothetical protein